MTEKATETEEPTTVKRVPKKQPDNAEKHTPAELAKRHQQIKKPPKTRMTMTKAGPLYTWEHRAADTLHGWRRHDVSDPYRLTDKDYLAALKAATKPGPSGSYEPHKPALSPLKKG